MMLEQLCPPAGGCVLEIGAGTGYNAALLSVLVGPSGRVVTIDIDAERASHGPQTLVRNLGGGSGVRALTQLEQELLAGKVDVAVQSL